jgi:tRNA modification GTPase
MSTTTIAALATPPGTGGIAIIKISGPAAVAIARSVFKPADGGRDGFQSHRLRYGHVIDPADGRILDEVLVAVMRAPRSYTREDVVEINAHGGPRAVAEILKTVLDQGAVLAEPGEFTRRAFLNGRIDLTQAEAVAELIQAQSEDALQAAVALAGGGLKREVERIQEDCTELLAEVNAAIDFPEEVVLDEAGGPALGRAIETRLAAPLRGLVERAAKGRVLREGVAVTIAGRPNVGKSSLMNRLLLRERAIVTPHPGTTRDIIEERLLVKGIEVRLCDTAGIRASRDPIESAGIARALEQLDRADLVLLVLEAHRPVDAGDEAIFSAVRGKPVLPVFNKCDLLAAGAALPALPAGWGGAAPVSVSALTGEGLAQLTDAIHRLAGGEGARCAAGAVIPNLRQGILLNACLKAAEAAVEELGRGMPLEIAALHLSEILTGCAQVLGTRADPDTLERIFSRFCIGK